MILLVYIDAKIIAFLEGVAHTYIHKKLGGAMGSTVPVPVVTLSPKVFD